MGSFVFSLGIVSTRSFTSGGSSSALNILRLTWRSIRKSSPILLLGLIRVLMVKGTDYPVSHPHSLFCEAIGAEVS